MGFSRKCNDDGTWGPVDYSNCTALDSAIPTLTVSFIVNVSRANAKAVADNVSLDALAAASNNITLKLLFIMFYVDNTTDSKQ